jgi:hypothetical protein
MSNTRSHTRPVRLDRSKLLGFDQLPQQSNGSPSATSRLTKVGEKGIRRSDSTPLPKS